MDNMFNITELLLDRHLAVNQSDKIAVIAQDNSFTYNELYEFVLKLSQLSQWCSLHNQSVVAIIFEDEMCALICFLALMRIGMIPCCLNPTLYKEEYKFYLKDSSCQFVLCSYQVYERLEETITQLNLNSYKFKLDDLKKILPIEENRNQLYLSEKDSLAFCLYTSGTTNNPSIVYHRKQDICITNQNYAKEILHITNQDIIFTTSKFFYMYGLNAILYSLYAGATIIIPPLSLKPENIWQVLFDRNVSVFFSVPSMYLRLLENAEILQALPVLRVAVSAGEHLPTTLNEQWFQRFNNYIIDGIGTTEVMSTFISNRIDKVKIGSTGKVVPGFLAKILGENKKELSHGETGILWIKGDTYQSAYTNNQEATKERFQDGWFKTNDLFSKDNEGFFYYHGRASEIIKCGGIWIYPYRIENIILQHPAVSDCAVVGEKQTSELVRPVAYVVLKENYKQSTLLINELKQYCKEYGSLKEYPHFIYFISEIPKTPSGKKKRYLLEITAKKRVI